MFERLKRSYSCLRLILIIALRFSLRNPRKVLFGFLMATLFLFFGMSRLKTLLALEDVVEPSFASKQNLGYLLKEFKVHNSMILALKKPAGGWSEEVLCGINQWLTLRRVENPNILSSTSPLDIRRGKITSEYIFYPRIMHLSCLEESSRKYSPAEIEAQLQELRASPWGFSLTGVGSDDWLIQFDLKDAPEGTRYGSFDPTIVEDLQKSFAEEVKRAQLPVSYSWVGTADFQYYLYVGLKRVNILNLGLLILLILFFRWMFGSWRLGFLFCFSIIVTGVICYGLMGWSGVPVDILSKSLFLMIAVAALEDFVYLSAKTYELNGNWRKAWRQILMPGFLTSLTTVLGFLSLCISELQIIRRFGFWAAIGSVVEWGVIFIILPAVFRIFPWWAQFTTGTQVGRTRGYDLFNKLKMFRIPRKLSYVLLTVFLFVPMAFRNLNVKDVPLEMFSQDHPYKTGILDIKQRNGWEAQASLVFDPHQSEDEVAVTVAKVRTLPGVVRALGSPDLTAYFVKGIEKPEIKKMVLSELSSASFMENWLSKHGDRRYNLYLQEGDTESIAKLEAQVKKICEGRGCYLAGIPIIYAEFSRKVPETLLNSFTLSILLVSMVLTWLAYCCNYSSKLHWILLSSFWGPGLMFLFISAFSIKVNFLTCIFASVLVGLTGDNAIQFLTAGKGKSLESGILKGGGAALVAGFLMAISSLVFMGSYFIPPRIFGILLMAGFFASTLGDYWLLRALVKKEEESNE